MYSVRTRETTNALTSGSRITLVSCFHLPLHPVPPAFCFLSPHVTALHLQAQGSGTGIAIGYNCVQREPAIFTRDVDLARPYSGGRRSESLRREERRGDELQLGFQSLSWIRLVHAIWVASWSSQSDVSCGDQGSRQRKAIRWNGWTLNECTAWTKVDATFMAVPPAIAREISGFAAQTLHLLRILLVLVSW